MNANLVAGLDRQVARQLDIILTKRGYTSEEIWELIDAKLKKELYKRSIIDKFKKFEKIYK